MMLISAGRNQGKTHALLEWLRVDPESRVMICHNIHCAQVLKLRYPDLKDCFVSCMDTQQLRGRRCDVAIDNVNLVLHVLLNIDWEAIKVMSVDMSG